MEKRTEQNRAEVEAVSYTHLDVYKRQVHDYTDPATGKGYMYFPIREI